MKRLICAAAILAVAATSCNDSKEAYTPPAPGTVVDSMAMPVDTDPVNKFTFSVAVVADSLVQQGVYDVRALHGMNNADGRFTMPKGGERFKPSIRKGAQPETFIVGFHVPKDTTFYEYFEVTGGKLNIGMKYLRSYSFE